MAAADHQDPVPDLYQLLGVARDASRELIAQARRRRALAGAGQVLSAPGRRAAYDPTLGAGRGAAMPAPVPVPVRRVRPGGAAGPVPGPPLRAGPVRVSGTHAAPSGSRDEDEIRLALLAALALRCLARDQV